MYKKGSIPWNKGKEFMQGKNHPMYGVHRYAENSPNWKGGISKDNKLRAKKTKELRHKLGISKKYNSQLGVSKTKEYKKMWRQKRKSLLKGGGELSIYTIRLVYEDNIEVGQDSLEHKIPLIRGGNNNYENLEIACRKCNSSKGKKTEEEYRRRFL